MSKLAKERIVLIKDGRPTVKLQKVLYQIFSMYADHNSDISIGDVDMDSSTVLEIMASRLWYRCGMKLSTLDDILRPKEKRYAAFRDFFSLIQKVIDDEERENRSSEREKYVPRSSTSDFEVWYCLITQKIKLFLPYQSRNSWMLFISSSCWHSRLVTKLNSWMDSNDMVMPQAVHCKWAIAALSLMCKQGRMVICMSLWHHFYVEHASFISKTAFFMSFL